MPFHVVCPTGDATQFPESGAMGPDPDQGYPGWVNCEMKYSQEYKVLPLSQFLFSLGERFGFWQKKWI
jgi:hypothetical protein